MLDRFYPQKDADGIANLIAHCRIPTNLHDDAVFSRQSELAMQMMSALAHEKQSFGTSVKDIYQPVRAAVITSWTVAGTRTFALCCHAVHHESFVLSVKVGCLLLQTKNS